MWNLNGRRILKYPHCVPGAIHSVEISEFFIQSDFTWNQFLGIYKFKKSHIYSFRAFKTQKWQSYKHHKWFHVKSEWKKNPEISTLWSSKKIAWTFFIQINGIEWFCKTWRQTNWFCLSRGRRTIDVSSMKEWKNIKKNPLTDMELLQT